MTVNGKEIDFKITRVGDAEKFSAALKVMEKDEEELQKKKDVKMSLFLRSYIKMFSRFFINATGVDVLEGCDDAQEAQEAYLDFLKEVNKSKTKIMRFKAEDIG